MRVKVCHDYYRQIIYQTYCVCFCDVLYYEIPLYVVDSQSLPISMLYIASVLHNAANKQPGMMIHVCYTCYTCTLCALYFIARVFVDLYLEYIIFCTAMSLAARVTLKSPKILIMDILLYMLYERAYMYLYVPV